MKINEINKGDLIALEFMSGECLSHALDIATQDDVEVLQTGTGSSPTIFNIERDGLHGAIFISHLRNSGIHFDDVSGEGHVSPAMQGKSAMMRDEAERQGFDVTDLPFTTDLDEDGEGADPREKEVVAQFAQLRDRLENTRWKMAWEYNPAKEPSDQVQYPPHVSDPYYGARMSSSFPRDGDTDAIDAVRDIFGSAKNTHNGIELYVVGGMSPSSVFDFKVILH